MKIEQKQKAKGNHVSKPNDPRAGFRNQLLLVVQIVAEQERGAQMSEAQTVFNEQRVVSALTVLDHEAGAYDGMVDAGTEAMIREMVYTETYLYLLGRLNTALRLKLANNGMTSAVDASDGRVT